MQKMKEFVAKVPEPADEWFAFVFLRSWKKERKSKWWLYPNLNKGIEIPLCLLLLAVGGFANFLVLMSSDFLYFTGLKAYSFVHQAIIFVDGLLHILPAIGVWLRIPRLLVPAMASYFILTIFSFVYIFCSLASLINFKKEEFSIIFLLASLLPLGALVVKSLIETYLLINCSFSNQKMSKGIDEFRAVKINLEKRKNQKSWIDHLRLHEQLNTNLLGKQTDGIIAMDGRVGQTEDDDNLSQFYGQIAIHPINMHSKLNGKLYKSMRKSGSSTNASTVHLPNGEIRKRRYRKKKSTETTTMKGMESLINEESSANEQLTKSANRLENTKRCDPPMELTINNERNGIVKQQNKTMGNNSQHSKKAPVPRPRKFLTNFTPENGGIFVAQTTNVKHSPMSQSDGSVLASPMTAKFLEIFRETEV